MADFIRTVAGTDREFWHPDFTQLILLMDDEDPLPQIRASAPPRYSYRLLELRTNDEAEALARLHSKNEAYRQPVLNSQIARTYLTATDPQVANRTWQTPMDEMTKTKTGPTRHPSGESSPPEADIKVTRDLIHAGRF